jgi:hypothetical protein
MLSDDQYETDAKVLRKAMEGWGTDEGPIIELTTKRSNADRQKIIKFYKSSFGRDVIEDLSTELSGDVRNVVLAMFRTAVDYDCFELNKAMKGGGTDEETLIEIISSRSNSRLKEIKTRYEALYKVDLEAEVADETGGDLKRLLVSLLQCNRSEDTDIDQVKLGKDLADLYEAGEGSWGTDESVFNKIFTLRSPVELRYLNAEYTKHTGKTLFEVIDSEFGGDICRLLKAILFSILSPSEYFAKRIREACKGMGTNDDLLIRVLVSRDEVDLKQINSIYKEKYQMSLADQVKDECSGDYKNILLGLVSN